MPRSLAVTPESSNRSEVEVLLSTARTELASEEIRRIQALVRGPLDWEALIRIAHLHRVIPLLYRHLSANCPDDVPETVLKQLHKRFHSNAAKVDFRTKELFNLLHLLEVQGIPAVAFKGPVLAASVYGNPYLRQIGKDLDILIHKQDVSKARDALVSEGYLPISGKSHPQMATQLKRNHVYGLVGKDGRIIVELQWDITRSFLSSPVDTVGLWDRLQTVPFDGKTLPSLGPEDLLLVLCVHGAKHCWFQLRWMCDVAELIRAKRVNWARMEEQASKGGGMRMVSLGVLLASDLFGVELPSEVLHRAQKDQAAKSLASETRARLFTARAIRNPLPLQAIHFNIKARERIRDKIRCFSYFTTPTQKDHELPSSLSFASRVIRPARLIGRFSMAKWRRLPDYKSPSMLHDDSAGRGNSIEAGS